MAQVTGQSLEGVVIFMTTSSVHKNQFEGRINFDHWLQQENSGQRT